MNRKIGLWMLLCVASAAWGQAPLKDGDRVVFLGDSITEQRMHTRFVMNYFTLRYPGLKATFRNAGWGGDRAPGGLNRLQRDVLALKPTVVTICYGMNDGGYCEFKQNLFEDYMKGMEGLVREIKKTGARVVLITPGVIDPDRTDARLAKVYNDTLGKFGKGVEELARKENLGFYNLHDLMLDVQNKYKKKDPKSSLMIDGGHPAEQGQAVMAYALLKAMGCKDQASGLEIDAAKSSATTDRCKVEELSVKEDSITFKRFDDALPTYLPPKAHSSLEFFPFTKDFNQYNFKVAGLKAGQWTLTVEGAQVGTFSDKDLAAGVNLATLPGPWLKIGEKVEEASKEQENLYFTQWRGVSVLEVPGQAQAEHKELLKRMVELVEEQETGRINFVPKDRNWKWQLTWKENK